MEIGKVQNTFENNSRKKQDNSQKEVKSSPKEYDKNANDIKSSYSRADLSLKLPVDTSNLTTPIQMIPDKKYKITLDSKFQLGKSNDVFDLNEDEMKLNLLRLKPGSKMIIGRNDIQNLTGKGYRNISRQHLEIGKTDSGILYAKDLNSTNGTVLLPDFQKINEVYADMQLESGKRYLIPFDSKLQIGNSILDLARCKNFFNESSPNTPVIAGRNNSANIRIADPAVSNFHLKLLKTENGIIVQDTNSTNGTKLLANINNRSEYKKYVDCSNISQITSLGINSPFSVILPENSQIYFDNGLTIDTRNKKILNLLNEKGKITAGQNPYDNIRISGYTKYGNSGIRVELTKFGDKIGAKNLGKNNGAYIIPQNQVQPFYKGVQDLKLQQTNIGDCFLISTIYAMSLNPECQEILKNMVKTDNNGNYLVKFNAADNPILIRPDEIDGQYDYNGDYKESVIGEPGVRAIERAYGKMIKAENYSHTMFSNITNGGNMVEVMHKMTGLMPHYHKVQPNTLAKITKNGLDNHVLTCITPSTGKYGNGRYIDKNCKFDRNHAYTIKRIDSEHQTIEIVNPYDTSKSNVISWEDFSQIFSDMYDTDLNSSYNKLMSKLYRGVN